MLINNTKTHSAKITCIALSLLLASSLLPLVRFSQTPAFAETDNIDAQPDEFQSKIEESAKRYEEATSESAELQRQIEDNQARIDEINLTIPTQQEKADASMRELYDLNHNFGVIINMILGIESLSDAIDSYNYLDHIRSKNVEQIKSLTSMREELDVLQSGLTNKKDEAEAKAQEAQSALAEAQAAREEAQRKAQEQAERERAAIEEAARQQQTQASQSEEQENAQEQSSTSEGAVTPNNDGADWSTDKATFVNEWASRIDAYLSGSPLSGQGRVFAEAAWDYGVDPRWSPAISNTESSKGAYCFMPHNAWGWGSISWDSWDEAIRAHVRGLANGYGYTISEEAAKKYCPPNWLHWYNVTSAEMNKI